MKKILIIEDVRLLGVGYTPGADPIEVDDDVATELLKGEFAAEFIEEEDGSLCLQAANKPTIEQGALFAAPENAAITGAPENK